MGKLIIQSPLSGETYKLDSVNYVVDSEDSKRYKALQDGSLINYKANVTELAAYRFDNFNELETADFTGITEIPVNTCTKCLNLKSLILDPNTTKIGDYAF